MNTNMDKDDPEEMFNDDYDTYHREKEFVQEISAKYNVLMFSKTWCPFCKLLKALFDQTNTKYCALELDTHSNGPNIQDALEELTGSKRPVPAVYICQKFRGGYNEIYAAWANGTLEEWTQCIDTDFPFDMVVIGGGSGGIAAAKEAARLGKKVALCDYVAPTPKGVTWGLGGTCANVGCIPKKLMHRASIIYHDIKDAECFGWEVEPPEFHNWETMIEKIQEHIKTLNWDFKKQLRELGIAYYTGKGVLKDRHTVEVTDGDGKKTDLQGSAILIAVGGRPMYLDAVGAERYCITSDDIFSLKTNPGRTLIIGCGPNAVECASFLNVFGCEVKLMVRKKLLNGLDQDFVDKIVKHLEARGIDINYKSVITRVSRTKDRKKLQVEGKTQDGASFSEIFDTVMIAISKWANTECIGLMNAGVKLDHHTKKVMTNRKDQTSVSNIFAVGDCRYGSPELTAVAKKSGKLLAQRLYNMGQICFDYNLVPMSICANWEYSYVGETEEHATEIHGDIVEVYHNIYQPPESVLSNRFDSRSYVKLICLKIPAEGEKIVGLHILGPNAGEIIQGYALAIKMGAKKDQLDSLIGVHPSSAEPISNLRITKRSGEEINKIIC